MPISVVHDDTRFLIRLDGDVGIADAAELKRLLLQGFASGLKLHLDLEPAAAIDVSLMQLLHAASREADRVGAGIAVHLSEAAQTALRGAGFAPLAEGRGVSA